MMNTRRAPGADKKAHPAWLTIRFHKVVRALPGDLDANAIYAVRTGVGFDLHVTDATGQIVHSVNSGTATSVVIAMPPRPSDTAVFDDALKAWTEPFTPEQLVQQRREVAVIDRFTFCTRCREQRILSVSDALTLGHGQIPPATHAILDMMSPADSFDAELRWASMTTVRRLDPLIVATMAATGIPEILLDHLFDV